jgi:hypothetical protein
MRSIIRLVLISISTVAVVWPASAQDQNNEDVLGVIAVMFHGLAARDTASMSTVLDPGARLVQTTTDEDGLPRMTSVNMESFLGSIGRADGPEIEERYWDPQVVVHDNLATVWISYVFLVEGAISHCGEDAFQLARTTDGWKIIAIADTQRRQGCEDQSQ